MNTDKIIKYCVEHPYETVKEISKRFKIPTNTAFCFVKEAGKILNDNDNKKNDTTTTKKI